MWISRRAYEDLLAAHKREVDILAAWVESLQMSQGSPAAPLRGPEPSTTAPDISLYVSEDEEQLLEALANNMITEDQFQAELQRMREAGHVPSLSVVD